MRSKRIVREQMRTTWTTRLAGPLVLAALGFGAFFLSRATLAKDQEAQANPAPAVQSAPVCPDFTVTVPAGPTPRPPPPCATAVVVTVCPNFTATVPAGATPLRVPPCVVVSPIILKDAGVQTAEAVSKLPGFYGELNGFTFYDPSTHLSKSAIFGLGTEEWTSLASQRNGLAKRL